jgi:hypothetical protein
VILAENSAEYTYGTRVFIVSKTGFLNSQDILDAGDLDVGVEWKSASQDINLVSVVPHTKIIKDGDAIVFSFTQDLVMDPGGQKERKISKDKIRYIYIQGKLQAVIDPSPAKVALEPPEHSDRVIQSKKVQGRFIKSIWGDYLYSFVGTKSGEIRFMINSDESCFLRQHRQSELSIDYDVVDRYIPQASSYGHYNIIRNVQSKKTNLATWLKSVTKKELDQCEKQDQADTAREK